MSALIDKYTIDELKHIVKTSYSIKEVILKLGYRTSGGSNNKTITKRIKQYNIDTSHFKKPKNRILTEQDIFVKNSTTTRKVVRDWYKKNNYTEYKCSICGLKPMWQNKPLTLILDHINGVNNDHRLENLRWICPNCNQQLDTTNGKNKKKLTIKKHCIICGTVISKKSTYCKKCNPIIYKSKNLNDMKIDRITLKKLIRSEPFIKIGRIFNVSDNAIRKWCNKYGLPKTKKEINSYSDEEWINI